MITMLLQGLVSMVGASAVRSLFLKWKTFTGNIMKYGFLNCYCRWKVQFQTSFSPGVGTEV